MLPRSPQYVNIHAHRMAVDEGEWVLTSLFAQDYPPERPDEGVYSVGIHPWHLREIHQEELLKIVRLSLENNHVLAVGEAGLDKMAEAPMEEQEALFRAQVDLAELADVPVVVHAVKTHHLLLEFMKQHTPSVPVIIHGYQGSRQMAEDLVEAGCFLSFGETLLQDRPKQREAFAAVPPESLFLETDESEVPIVRIYEAAAEVMGMETETLREVMLQNVATCFG